MKFTFPPESRPLSGYTIKRAIHKGGFGEVYYALSEAGKEVALKLLHGNTEVELRGVSQCLNLKHPNLINIIDIRRDNDHDYWIIMEYVAGRTLDEVLSSNPNGLPLPAVQHWLNGLAAGLAFLHDKGIVHRDLKPANLFDENGVIKIGDVGLAKFISDSRRNAQTESVGTVYYMAPEVARGHYGHEVDVYSLGVVLFEMLTGRVPFEGESTAEILMKHLSQPPDLSLIPERLRPVLARALEKDPLRRTPSATQLRDEFAAAIGTPAAQPVGTAAAAPFRPAMETPPPRTESSVRPPPLPTLPPNPYVDKYARRYQRKAEKWAERYRRKQDKYARKLARRTDRELASNPTAAPRGNGLHFWLRLLAVGVVLTAIFRPGMLQAAFPSIAFGGAIAAGVFLTYKLISQMSAPVPAPRAYGSGLQEPGSPEGMGFEAVAQGAVAGTIPRSPPPPIPGRTAVAYTQEEYRGRHMDPMTPRFIPLRQRMLELTSGMTAAILFTAVMTAVLSAITPLLPQREQIVHFGLVTLLGSWAVMAVSKGLEGHGPDHPPRRMLFLAMGACVGAAAYWLGQQLLVEFPHDGLDAAFTAIGSHALTEENQPTLVAYMIFFGFLMGLRRWWWHADTFRSKRFRLSSVLLTTTVAFLLTTIWAFPVSLGTLWAVTISSVVQLASAWTPPAQRVASL